MKLPTLTVSLSNPPALPRYTAAWQAAAQAVRRKWGPKVVATPPFLPGTSASPPVKHPPSDIADQATARARRR